MEQQQPVTDHQFRQFISAIKNQSFELVEDILKVANPAILNQLEPQFRQPALYFAAILPNDQSSAQLIKLLIRNGANAKHKDHNEQTILFYVCREGKEKCAEILLSHGLSLDEVDVYGQTPIFYAVNQNRLQIALKYCTKQRTNYADKLAGQTPLYYAARRGHLQMCKLLVEKGADVSHTDVTNKSPAEYAKKAKFVEVCEYLNGQLRRLKQNNKFSASVASIEQSSLEKGQRKRKNLEDVKIKQTYKIVFVNDKGQSRDLSEEQVAQLIKNKADLSEYLANPQSIPQDGLMGNQADSWDKIAFKVFTQCSKFKGSYYFMEPVDPIKLNIPDYKTIITSPMDLGTIRKKLTHNCYTSPHQFITDMNLIWNNSYTYNGLGHVVSIAGKELQNMFNETIQSQGLNHYLERVSESE